MIVCISPVIDIHRLTSCRELTASLLPNSTSRSLEDVWVSFAAIGGGESSLTQCNLMGVCTTQPDFSIILSLIYSIFARRGLPVPNVAPRKLTWKMLAPDHHGARLSTLDALVFSSSRSTPIAIPSLNPHFFNSRPCVNISCCDGLSHLRD